ncbi:Chromatin structure remodeling complex protein sfh1 [Saitozyma podzolica]|uniref:Chromatin structure remodeling complex protein sfh1 n=1 Tax=Saitozyma podzolica TaxID=1890683 RepID=A0A427YNQ4_9TREE|nr:Chromatin structure remodeling complex protein sfh1 [Saitozyma podzolica]
MPPSYRPQPQAAAAVSHRPQVYQHPPTYEAGPLPYFLPPPGQTTTDPTLSRPPVTQAYHSTYPSRLRTGVSGLIQPEVITGGPKEREYFLAELDREIAAVQSGSGASTPRFDSPAPFPRKQTTTTTFSGRRGRVVNYAEKESEDEDEDDMSDIGEAPSDPEDMSYGERRKRATSALDRSAGAAMRAGRLRKKREEMERGWTWLGDRAPGDRVRSIRARPTRHQYVSEELLEREADRPEVLIPISIDLDIPSGNVDQPGIKVKDRFLWNVNEPFVTPHQFASILCDDIGIPPNPYATTIAELIQAQVEEAQSTVEIDVTDKEATEDDVVWSDDEVEEAMDLDHLPVNGDANGEDEEDVEVVKKEKEWKEADCRIIVNLEVQIYTHILRDRIEWDLSSSLQPSQFATQYCRDLGLTGEAIPLITVAIHEELLKHKKDALELELFAATHPEAQAKWEKAPGGAPRVNRREGARALVGVWRDWWEREEYGPVLVELTMEEMERREMERTREARRMMRTLATAKRRR